MKDGSKFLTASHAFRREASVSRWCFVSIKRTLMLIKNAKAVNVPSLSFKFPSSSICFENLGIRGGGHAQHIPSV
jgi:hypothetical protein